VRRERNSGNIRTDHRSGWLIRLTVMSRRSVWHWAPTLTAVAVASICRADERLLGAADLVHVGSFNAAAADSDGFGYGGTAIAFNAAKGSLFIVGLETQALTAEIEIPPLGGTAKLLQPLTDSLGGTLGAIGDGDRRIGGNLVYRDKLYVSGFLFYDAAATQRRSHFSRPLTLSDGPVAGPLQVGRLGAGFYSGYMGLVPAAWQARLGGPALTGNCCLSIISRTSYGPAAFAFDPEDPGNARPLVYYTADRQTLGRYVERGAHPVFNGSTRITGIVFPEDTASVLFFGMTGVGNYCYGEGAECQDPASAYKGEHAYPYHGWVWAYDANDLAAVSNRRRQPWDVVPYATWQLQELGDVSPNFGVGGAAYDPASRRVYVSKKFGDGDRPLIHVYEIR
jgi:hypothetical protein